MVSLLASSAVDLGSNTGRVKPKIIYFVYIVFTATASERNIKEKRSCGTVALRNLFFKTVKSYGKIKDWVATNQDNAGDRVARRSV